MIESKSQILWIKAIFIGLVPLLGGIIFCASQGQSIFEISLLYSEWNDELFYFKQVEGILEYGIPQGFFGFNESKAQYLSFAAWSPLLVIPWIIWGALFGWTLNSPIMCNIVIIMIIMFIFAKVVNLKQKNIVVLTILYLSNFFWHRYVLSGMVEVICLSGMILYFILCYEYLKGEKAKGLARLYVCVFCLTLMRPYLLMFILFPSYYSFRESKLRGSIYTIGCVGVSVGVYFSINQFLGASYFVPLFNVGWLKTFFEQGVMVGIRAMFHEITNSIIEIKRYLLYYQVYGDGIGGLYLQFLVVVFILGITLLLNRHKKDKKYIISSFIFIWDMIIFSAMLVMYHVQQGSRHLLVFTMFSLFAIAIMEVKLYRRMAVIGAVFFISFFRQPENPSLFHLPNPSIQFMEEYEVIKEKLNDSIALVMEDVPTYDNVLLWVLNDQINGEIFTTPWQVLYGVPAGMGISCVESTYVLENFWQLQSKYIATIPNGEIDIKCKEEGKKEILVTDKIIIYELR